MSEATSAAPPVQSSTTTPPSAGTGTDPKPPAQSEPTGEPSVSEIRKYKVKVDGNELEVDDQELVRGYQLSKTSYQRLEEAKKLQSQVEQFQELLDADPVKALEHLAKQKGKNVGAYREAMERHLYDLIRQEQLSPQERERLALEEKVKAYEEEKKTASERAEQEEMQRLQQHYQAEYDKQITEALNTADLPKTPATVRRMASLMQKNLQLGLDLQPAQIVKMVRDEYLEEQREILGKLDGESLLKFLGEDLATKIRKHDVAKLKAGQKTIAKPPTKQPEPAAPAGPKKNGLNEDEWNSRLRRIMRGEG
jgi:hypothetical protein